MKIRWSFPKAEMSSARVAASVFEILLTRTSTEQITMDDVTTILRYEFEAGPESFLLQLRCDLHWDRQAFNRLTAAMYALVRERDAEEPIQRWIAEGFWYLDTSVRDWSQHESFPREHESAYYEKAYELLHNLAYWLFVGESPCEEDKGSSRCEGEGNLVPKKENPSG